MEPLLHKYEQLKDALRALGSTAVAFSGGVDSAFLLDTAHRILGEQAIAVTVSSCFFPARELSEAAAFCREHGIRQYTAEVDVLGIDGVADNPANRCYLCKRGLFERILAIAEEQGIPHVAEGSNLDDLGDYRPGLMAIRELGILSPLREAGLTKQDIRLLSKQNGLPTWDKPSYACLASRLVYGEAITREKLSMVEKAEQYLIDLGFKQMRVRLHGSLARIEVPPEEMPKLIFEDLPARIAAQLKALGFTYVTLDLMGYRTGSMNETIL